MIDKDSQEYKQFENLWEGVTPKGKNISKRNRLSRTINI